MNENQKRFLDDMEIAQQLYIIEMVNEEDKKITVYSTENYENSLFKVFKCESLNQFFFLSFKRCEKLK